MSGDSVSMATNVELDKDEETGSIADSGHESASVITAPTFTGESRLSEVRVQYK